MIEKCQYYDYCNTYLLWKDKSKAIVIDPGCNINNCLINHIFKLGLTITSILLTHGHFDHIGALKDIIDNFPNAKTYIGYMMKEEISDPDINLSTLFIRQKISYLPSNLILLADYEKINISGYEILSIYTPFHTIGSMCYYIKEEKYLFTGDTLFQSSIGRVDLPSGSPKDVKTSLKKLLNLPINCNVYCGHGPNTTIERELKYNSYLRNI